MSLPPGTGDGILNVACPGCGSKPGIKGIELREGHEQGDHVYLCLGIMPKYSVSSVVGFLKGKSAIRLHQEFSRAKNSSKHFWIWDYFVSTVGRNEKMIRAYIRHQEFSGKR